MDPTDLGPGTATWLGGTGTVLIGGVLWLRRFLSKDAADRAMDNADIGTVRRLNELLDELAAAVGRMEGKIEALTSQVSQLTDKVTSQSAEIASLRSQLRGTA